MYSKSNNTTTRRGENMDLSQGIVLLVTHSFEVNHTDQTNQAEKVVLKRGEIYPLLHSSVNLLSNSDGSYTGIPAYLINYKKNKTYIPIYIEACAEIKIINQNEFDIDKYFTLLNSSSSDTSSYRKFDTVANAYDVLPATSAAEQGLTFDGKTVRAYTNFLRVKSASLFPLNTPIVITDGTWTTSTHAINIAFSLYVLNSSEIRILFEATGSHEDWEDNALYDDYIEKMKETIEEYPYLIMDYFQNDVSQTRFVFSYLYKTKTKDEPLEYAINWGYDIISDIQQFTDKRIMFLLQEQE
ncbi:hypothetical protein ACFFMS_24415 [Ectobacillus funiculus]|uniref:Uncharacterized protein n=2 Tax=Ectobacillus funiculus TaxID=137993 RepID=A0ABV5WLE7_9BACI